MPLKNQQARLIYNSSYRKKNRQKILDYQRNWAIKNNESPEE